MKSTLVFTRIAQLIVVGLALAAALVLGFGLVPLVRAQTDIYVHPLGDDVNCNGTADVDYSPVVAPDCAVQTIQKGIELVNTGGQVYVRAGEYFEDLIIDKSLTLSGEGQGSTTLYPATGVPTCTTTSSLCYDNVLDVYSATTICLVRADNVTIHDLTMDGDSYLLDSGVIVNGADVDARNGIVGDYVSFAPSNLEIYSVTVQNTYLRGIYATGNLPVTDIDFHDNVIRNVAGEWDNSAAMMFWQATGSMVNNTVEDTVRGLFCYMNSTCLIQENDITDARQAGISVGQNSLYSTGDTTVISNTVTGGWMGIEASYQDTSLTVIGNTVNDAAVGIVVGGNSANPSIENNQLDATGVITAAGIVVETSGHHGADQNTSATVRDNEIHKMNYGVVLGSGTGLALTAVLDGNLIDDTLTSGVDIRGPGSLNVALGDSLAAANTFRNTAGLLVRLVNAANDIPARFNDWEVTDLDDIELAMYHQVDNSALGEVLYYGLTVNAAPTNVEPDGIDSATITATLTGLYAPQNNLVSFVTSLGTLSSASDTTAPDGTATTSITSDSPGKATIIASAGYKDATTTVNFGGHDIYLPLIHKYFTPAQ